MANRKILIRFDDVCPTMNWEQWENAMRLLDSIHASALIGIIPDCKDPVLQIDAPRPDFWEYIKRLQDKGFVIAMHGLNHTFSTKADGIVTKNKISEFAGLSYAEQLEKIRQGKTILQEHGIETDVFFAPAHSYDDNTLRALAQCGFLYISDGLSLRPYNRHGVVCVPCHANGIPRIKRYGHYTAVIHTHEWSWPEKAYDWKQFQQLCQEHKDEIVSFAEFSKWELGNASIERTLEKMHFFTNRHIIPMLSRIKRTLL